MAKKKPAKVIGGLSEHRKNFVKLLNEFGAYGYSRYNVFNDFSHMAALSIANSSDPYNLVNPQSVVEEREKQYKNIIGKYKPELQNRFGDMYAELALEMETYCPNHLTDVLGELFMELGFGDQWKGQCFTPQSVCDMMGMMNFNDVDRLQTLIDDKGFVTVNDGTVGAGAIILGAANGMTYHGFNPQKQMLAIVNDIDERCIHMCYIQLSLYGLPAIVQRQNTLTLETFGAAWYTPMFVFGGWTLRAWRMFKDDEQSEVAPIVEPEPVIEPQFGQLSLF
ncbi:MAG: hypothetical protein IJQ82_02260 [Selenomonadaceae bacterium]|nr:hypothetical protein [Selenomonadaceae bacterium]